MAPTEAREQSTKIEKGESSLGGSGRGTAPVEARDRRGIREGTRLALSWLVPAVTIALTTTKVQSSHLDSKKKEVGGGGRKHNEITKTSGCPAGQ